jgi:CPA1 family monovalent cation:H+ antiporter
MGTESSQLITSVELTLFWMLVAVAVVAVVTKRIRLPYTVALVVAGLIIAVVPGTPTIELTPELIVAVFLPTLIFEAAYNLDFSHLRENLRAITILAIPGVLLTATIVAALVHFVGGFAWPVAFLFGAIVSATDPVSVVAVFKELGAPTRLRTILEGESLFNDGTSIVFFNLIVGIVLAGTLNIAASLTQFAVVVVGGLLLGLVLGYAFSYLLSHINDYLLETVLTIVLAYGTYFLAELVHVSGIIAIVAAGLLVGNYGQRVALSPSSKLAVGLSWELFGFIANSLIFLFVGLHLKSTRVEDPYVLVAVAIAAVLLSRGLVVGLVGAALRLLRLDRPLPLRWQAILAWGGLRGALSLALALSIPFSVGARREEILVMTFGVILFSLLVQGLTMKPLLQRLQLVRPAGALAEYERTQAELRTTRAALNTLQAASQRGQVGPDVVAELHSEYQAREESLRERLSHLNIEHAALRDQAVVTERRALLLVEKSVLRDLYTRGEISEDTLRELNGALDLRLHELDDGLPDEAAPPAPPDRAATPAPTPVPPDA